MTEFDHSNPRNRIATTVEIAQGALEQLQNGNVDQAYKLTAHALILCTGEPAAATEGTLLMAGADLLLIGSSENVTRVNRAMQRIGPSLDFAEQGARRDGLRPIGQAILAQCIELAPTDELRARLSQISEAVNPQ